LSGLLVHLSVVPHEGRSWAVYAATNLLRKAYKFARPISTITWAVFFASPR